MNRIAYFVPIKNKDGMAVGPVSPDQLSTLLNVLKEADAQGKGIVFFLFRNEPDPEKNRKSIATLTVAVERDRPQSGGNYQTGRKPIGNTSAPKADPLKDMFGNSKQEKKGW